MIGICGDDCDACPRLAATAANDEAALARIAELWVRLGWRDPSVSPSELRCRGCGSSPACAYPEQRACAVERGLASCGECDELPCALVVRAFERTEQTLERCRARCSPAELSALAQAFGRKRETLDRIHALKRPR